MLKNRSMGLFAVAFSFGCFILVCLTIGQLKNVFLILALKALLLLRCLRLWLLAALLCRRLYLVICCMCFRAFFRIAYRSIERGFVIPFSYVFTGYLQKAGYSGTHVFIEVDVSRTYVWPLYSSWYTKLYGIYSCVGKHFVYQWIL